MISVFALRIYCKDSFIMFRHLAYSRFVEQEIGRFVMYDLIRGTAFPINCMCAQRRLRSAHSQKLIRVFAVRLRTLRIFAYPKSSQGRL